MSQKNPEIKSWEIEHSSERECKDLSVSIGYPKSKRDQISTDALSIIALLSIPNESKYSYDIEAEIDSINTGWASHEYFIHGYTLTIDTTVNDNNPLSLVREFIKSIYHD